MDYPILHWHAWGGGLLIALVATIHVFIAHFAVGVGLFIAVMETRVQRLGLTSLKDYLRRYARFFLVLTMVVGGLTGVGIWFSISIIAPGGTSVLIHAFVLGWATEWTFFLAEIVTLLTYMRSFEAAHSTRRLILAWLYFAFAFGSLAMVQGFISYMLTPGDWLTTHRYWDGFFNPTYLPGLVLRAAIAATLAGVFGLVTAQGVDDGAMRKKLSRFCALWAVLPLPVAVAAGWWHIAVLSPEQQALVWGRSPEVAAGLRLFWWVVPCVLAGGVLISLGLPRKAARVLAILTLAASFLYIGSFEFMRESARRPYLVTDYMYSNGIRVAEAAALDASGILAKARWVRNKTVTDDNRLSAGREIYFLECASCHSLGGVMLDIESLSAKYTTAGMTALLTGLGKVGRYMPPFIGTAEEKVALAAYLTQGLHPTAPVKPAEIAQAETSVPAFDPDTAEYVLTAQADFAINMQPDADGRFTLGLPGQGLSAQLVLRGPAPDPNNADVTVSYEIEGQGSGQLTPGDGIFRAENIALSPYTAAGGFMPYPLATVKATDKDGKTLAATKAVLPVSTELGCKNCHGGNFSHGVAGIAQSTADDILKAHDRLNLTRLAASDTTVDCRSCHDDKATGGNRQLNLSAAIHGLHAVYMASMGADACNMCHPTDPDGATRAFRDPHADAGFDCTNCHGGMADHAKGLLLREKAEGVAAAQKLIDLIPAGDATPVARTPWINEPMCLTCHVDYGSPQGMDAYGTWSTGADALFRNARDEMGAMVCTACHGPAHAVYPATNPYGADRDNLQPLQYQKLAKTLGASGNCAVCHQTDMDTPAHHEGMGLQ